MSELEISYMSDGSQHRVLSFPVGQQAVDAHVLVLGLFDQMVCPVNMQNSEPDSPICKGHGEKDSQPVGRDWSPGTPPKHSHLHMCKGQIEWPLSSYRHSDRLLDFAVESEGLGRQNDELY